MDFQMPVIRISDVTFKDISTLKTWFGTKSPSETIDQVVQVTLQQLGIERDTLSEDKETADSVLIFDQAPSLSFAKLTKATINGRAVRNPNWNAVLLSIVKQVKTNGLNDQDISRELGTISKLGARVEKGYKYYPELGVSIQGQSAPDAWKTIDRLAKKWHIPISIEFIWAQNPRAQHPGRSGMLRSG